METPKNLEETLQSIIDSEEENEVKYKAKNILLELRKRNKVCLLKKSLYGLRQAGRSWYVKLDNALRKYGAAPTMSDPFSFQIGSGEDVTLIVVYVDDILITSRSQKKIAELGRKLATDFEVKDLGPVSYCLGIEFSQTKTQISMRQRGYITELLLRFGMTECKPVSTPIETGTKLKKNEKHTEEDTRLPYRELLGALIYVSTTTRPDIAFAVSSLGQFNNCYGVEHWKAAKRVLRYPKGTINAGLTYQSNRKPIIGYVCMYV